MSTTIPLQKPLWNQFKSQRGGGCLEVWEDQRLDEEIRRDVCRNGLWESNAVPVLRRYRQEQRK